MRTRLLGGTLDARLLAIGTLTRWGLWVALAPLVGLLVARRPISHSTWTRRLPLYVLAASGCALLHNAGTGIVYDLLRVYPRTDTLWEAIGRLLLTSFGIDMVVFAMIAGLYHAVRYHLEVRERDRHAAALEARLIEARLELLRAQLNPHFLFNTLNAISTLALEGHRDQVVETLGRLGELLRAALDRDLPQEIALAREMELLEAYLGIQRVRFGERLEVRPEIAPETYDALVPSMLLQPLVENSLQHGIETSPGPGHVTVSARREGDSLRLRVEDSGPGFRAGHGERAGGIGLQNTRARLETLYAGAQSLECGDLAGGGAFVQLTLPFRTARP